MFFVNCSHTELFYETLISDSSCSFMQLMFSAGQVRTKVCYRVTHLSNHMIVGCKLLNLEKVPVQLIMTFTLI